MKLTMMERKVKNVRWKLYGSCMSVGEKVICMWQNSGRYSDKLVYTLTFRKYINLFFFFKYRYGSAVISK